MSEMRQANRRERKPWVRAEAVAPRLSAGVVSVHKGREVMISELGGDQRGFALSATIKGVRSHVDMHFNDEGSLVTMSSVHSEVGNSEPDDMTRLHFGKAQDELSIGRESGVSLGPLLDVLREVELGVAPVVTTPPPEAGVSRF